MTFTVAETPLHEAVKIVSRLVTQERRSSVDGQYFDRFVRTLSSGASRRNVLTGLAGGLFAVLPIALGGDEDVAAKKKHKKKKKGEKPTCTPNCPIQGRECNTDADGCGGTCKFGCEGNNQCNVEGQCVCAPDCAGKACGDNGCGGSCGSCQNGTCSGGGQCFCAFPPSPSFTQNPPCSPGLCTSCGLGVCCSQGQTCLNGACGACPEIASACTAGDHFCGTTTAPSPFCYCLTSVEDVTTCSSIFADPAAQIASIGGDCETDAECEGVLDNLTPGVEAVCVNLPCLSSQAMGLQKICVNKGCENLFADRVGLEAKRSTSTVRQLKLK